MIEEYDIGREFAEAAAAFTEHGDETLIRNFCAKYGIKYTLTTTETVEFYDVEEEDDQDSTRKNQ